MGFRDIFIGHKDEGQLKVDLESRVRQATEILVSSGAGDTAGKEFERRLRQAVRAAFELRRREAVVPSDIDLDTALAISAQVKSINRMALYIKGRGRIEHEFAAWEDGTVHFRAFRIGKTEIVKV